MGVCEQGTKSQITFEHMHGDVLLNYPLQFPRLTGRITPTAPRTARRGIPVAVTFRPISGEGLSSGNGGDLLVIPTRNNSHAVINAVEALAGEDTGVGSQESMPVPAWLWWLWWQWTRQPIGASEVHQLGKLGFLQNAIMVASNLPVKCALPGCTSTCRATNEWRRRTDLSLKVCPVLL